MPGLSLHHVQPRHALPLGQYKDAAHRIFSDPNSAVTPAEWDNVGGEWHQAQKTVKAYLTGTCDAGTQQCNIDTRPVNGYVDILVEIGLPQHPKIKCHASHKCRATGDHWGWYTHEPQPANCATTGKPSPRVYKEGGEASFGAEYISGGVVIQGGPPGPSLHHSSDTWNLEKIRG